MDRTEVNNEKTLCLLMEFEKMMLGQKPNDNLTEGYIRVSDEMRLTFFNYVELITKEKVPTLGMVCGFLREIAVKLLFL